MSEWLIEKRQGAQMKRRWPAMALLMLLGGCSHWSASSHYAAAVSAAAFIRAARSYDRLAFDSYIDWPAVRSDIQAQLASGAVLQASNEAGGNTAEQIVRPSNFHFHAAPGSFGGMLGTVHLALMLRSAGDGQLCLPDGFWKKSCVLTLAREGGTWKVVGMSLELLRGDDAPSWSI